MHPVSSCHHNAHVPGNVIPDISLECHKCLINHSEIKPMPKCIDKLRTHNYA